MVWVAMYDALYNAPFAKPATLTIADSGTVVSLTAIEKTVADEQNGVQTVKPAAAVRVPELTENDVALDKLRGSSLTLNGKTRRIENYRLMPSPEGEVAGEAYLILIET